MKIGFDFDGIFVGLPPYVPLILIDLFYKGRFAILSRKNKDIKELHYRFPGYIERQIRILSHYPLFRPQIKPNVKSLHTLLKQNSIESYLISSRFGFLKKRTQNWVDKYDFHNHFEEVIFNYNNEQPHIFKDKMIKKLKLDAYVDDDLDLLKYLSLNNPSLKLYWIRKNSSDETLPKNIYPIKGLSELITKLK